MMGKLQRVVMIEEDGGLPGFHGAGASSCHCADWIKDKIVSEFQQPIQRERDKTLFVCFIPQYSL